MHPHPETSWKESNAKWAPFSTNEVLVTERELDFSSAAGGGLSADQPLPSPEGVLGTHSQSVHLVRGTTRTCTQLV